MKASCERGTECAWTSYSGRGQPPQQDCPVPNIIHTYLGGCTWSTWTSPCTKIGTLVSLLGCYSAFYLTSCSTSRTAAMRQDGFLEGLAAQVGHGREPRAEVWKQQALGEPCGRYWRTATCSYLLLLSTDVYSGAGWESITWDWDLWKGGAGQAKRTSYVNRRARTVRSQFP